MKKVLLISHSGDTVTVEAVADAIRRKGGEPVRFNTDLYPGDVQLDAGEENGKWRNRLFTENGDVHSLDEFESLWYRRIRIGSNLKKSLDAEYIAPSIDESRQTFFGMVAALDIFKLDDPLKMEWANRKQLQLQVAKNMGLTIPNTLITNEAEAVKKFYRENPHGVITKMQASFAIMQQGQEQVVFTNSVNEDALDELEQIRFCPMTFQENVPKKLELRTIIVGNKLFTASVDSQKASDAKDDWRKKGLSFVNDWEKFDLPAEVEESLLKFMQHFGLNYGAFDFILTPDDQLYFLEINTAGEFYWLERKPGFPISESLAGLLLGNEQRR